MSETDEFAHGASELRRHKLMHLRAASGYSAFGYPLGVIPGVQGTVASGDGDNDDDDKVPTMGPQFPDGGGPVTDTGGSDTSGSTDSGGSTT